MQNSDKKILIVEDDDYLRQTLVDGLIINNYNIFQAVDGEDAVRKLVDHRPHLVLLDLMLPKLDGFKVLERIRHFPDQQIADTKVIVLSNLWSNKDILRAQALKVEEYFVKANTNLQDVFAKIKAHLDELKQAGFKG